MNPCTAAVIAGRPTDGVPSLMRSEPLSEKKEATPGAMEHSPDTQKLVDDEVRRIVAEARDEVLTLLTENRTRLDALAAALLEHETLDEDYAYAAAGVTRSAVTPAQEVAAAARSTT